MLEFALSKYSYHKSYLGEVEMENPSGHNGFYTKECWLMNIVCVFLIFIFTLNIGSVILTPFRKGKELTVENYREYININTYSAEFRRMPLTMSIEMTYFVDTYTDLLELTQKLISKLSFIQTYYVTYMGQSILCSYKIPESFEGDFSITLDGAYSDNKSRKLALNIELETNFPVFNNRSIIQSDNIIKNTDFDIQNKEEILKPRKYETK